MVINLKSRSLRVSVKYICINSETTAHSIMNILQKKNYFAFVFLSSQGCENLLKQSSDISENLSNTYSSRQLDNNFDAFDKVTLPF